MSGAVTPYAPVSARASVPATPAGLLPLPASPVLPAPSTFDVLPDLHRLLKRLLDTALQPAAATPTPSQSSVDGPLEIQHVATAANEIRLKIQKARRSVVALPEVDRTCEDQEEEMDQLEARIAKMKASLWELGHPDPEDTDQSMTG